MQTRGAGALRNFDLVHLVIIQCEMWIISYNMLKTLEASETQFLRIVLKNQESESLG